MNVTALRTLFLLCMLIGAACLILQYLNIAENIAGALLQLVIFQALAIIVYYSRKLRPYPDNLFFIPLALLTLAALMKIMHWKGADWLLIIGVFVLTAWYSNRFWKKQPKKRLDLIKWLWVLAILPARLLGILHLRYSDELFFLSDIILILLFAEFILFSDGIGFFSKLKWKQG